MREFIVKVYDMRGNVLRRFPAFASSRGGAMRRGYEAAATTLGAVDVVVVEV